MIHGRNFFDQPINNDMKTYENNIKNYIVQRDDYMTGCLLDYSNYKNYQLIAIDLTKEKTLDVDPKPIQQINFTANLERAGNKIMFFVLEEVEEAILDFSQETIGVL